MDISDKTSGEANFKAFSSIVVSAEVHQSYDQQSIPTGETLSADTNTDETPQEVNHRDITPEEITHNEQECLDQSSSRGMETENGDAIPIIIITGQAGHVPDAEYVVDQDGVVYAEVNMTKIKEHCNDGSLVNDEHDETDNKSEINGDIEADDTNDNKDDILKGNEDSNKLVTYKIFGRGEEPKSDQKADDEKPLYTAQALSPDITQESSDSDESGGTPEPSTAQTYHDSEVEWTLVEECLSKTAVVQLIDIGTLADDKSKAKPGDGRSVRKPEVKTKRGKGKGKIVMGPEHFEYTIVRGKKKKKEVSVRLLQEIDKKRAKKFGKVPKSYAEWKKIEKFEKTGIDYKKGQGRRGTPGEFPCNQCDYIASQKSHLQAHMAVHARKWIKCQYCKFETRSESKMMEHEARHTGDKPFKCDYEGCDYAGVCKGDLTKHLRKHQTDKPFKCDFCDFTTKWPRNIRHHLLTHTEERPFKCKECGYAFKRQSDLNYHMYRHSDDKPIKCDQCDFRCKTNFEIKCHKLKHSDVRKYQCTFPGCSQRTKTKSDLTKHMKIHSKTLDFVCDLCGKGFKTKDRLKKHQLRHSDERPWKCDLCDRRFKVKPALRKHINLHAGYKPHSCEICGMRFDGLGNKRKHMIVHSTKDRPLKCPICAYYGKTQDHILAHIGTMHGDKYAYFCEICKKPFKRYHLLQVHYPRCHTEEELAMLENTLQLNIQAIKSETIDEITRSELEKRNAEMNWDCIVVKDERIDESEYDANDEPSGTDDKSKQNQSSNETMPTSDLRDIADVKPDIKADIVPKPATLAIYDDFRLPLATVGFQFNFVKKGKKTKAWWMDTKLMDESSAKRHQKYLKRKQDEVLFGYYNSKRKRKPQGTMMALKEKKKKLFAAGKYWSNKGVTNKVIPYNATKTKGMPKVVIQSCSGSESNKIEAEKLLHRSVEKSKQPKKKKPKQNIYIGDYKKPKIPVAASKLKLNLKKEDAQRVDISGGSRKRKLADNQTNVQDLDEAKPKRARAPSKNKADAKKKLTGTKTKIKSSEKSSKSKTKSTKLKTEKSIPDSSQSKHEGKTSKKSQTSIKKTNTKPAQKKKLNSAVPSKPKKQLTPKSKGTSSNPTEAKKRQSKPSPKNKNTIKVKFTKTQRKTVTQSAPTETNVILSVDDIKEEPSDDYEQITADINNLLDGMNNAHNTTTGQSFVTHNALPSTSATNKTKRSKAAEVPDYLQPKFQKTNKRRGGLSLPEARANVPKVNVKSKQHQARRNLAAEEDYVHPKFYKSVPLEQLAVNTTTGMVVLSDSSNPDLIPLQTLTSALKGTSLSKDLGTTKAKKQLMSVDKLGLHSSEQLTLDDLQNKLRKASQPVSERHDLHEVTSQTTGSNKQVPEVSGKSSVYDISVQNEERMRLSKLVNFDETTPRVFNGVPLEKLAVDTNTGMIVPWEHSRNHLISLQTLSSEAFKGTSISRQPNSSNKQYRKQLTPVQNVNTSTLQKVKTITTRKRELKAATSSQRSVNNPSAESKKGKRNTKKKTGSESYVDIDPVTIGSEDEQWSDMPVEIEIDNAIESDESQPTQAFPVSLHYHALGSEKTIGIINPLEVPGVNTSGYQAPYCDDLAVMRASVNESMEMLAEGNPNDSLVTGNLRQSSVVAHIGLPVSTTIETAPGPSAATATDSIDIPRPSENFVVRTVLPASSLENFERLQTAPYVDADGNVSPVKIEPLLK